MSPFRTFIARWFGRPRPATRGRRLPPLTLCPLEDRVVPSDATAGAAGINARDLNLTGAGVLIGQVELGRPGWPDFDKAANSNADVIPTKVYREDKAPVADQDISGHAEGVAAIMIYKGAADKGVAPGASLHSATFVGENFKEPEKGANETEKDFLARVTAILLDKSVVTVQAMAQPKGNSPVRAINISTVLGAEALGNPALDGTSLLSAAVDYLTVKYDTLFVIAKGNDNKPTSTPADSYNALIVAGLDRVGFDRVGKFNDLSTLGKNDRRLIDVLAPGDVSMPVLGGGNFGQD